MITRRTILESFKTVRENTIEVAKDIPADKYDFRIVEGYNSVLEQFRQLITITEFMTTMPCSRERVDMTKKSRDEWFKLMTQTDVAALKSKDDVIKALESSFMGILTRVLDQDECFLDSEFLAPDGQIKTRLWVIQCAKEQEMSLRSQLYLYERALGIVPHLTRRQMERQAAMAKK